MAARQRSVSSLDAHLGFWLRYVSNQVSHAFAAKVHAHDATVAEWVVLRELYDDDQQPSALAGRLGMTRGAISKLADRLLVKRLITRTAAEGDGRAQVLALTAKGRALVPELAALADRNEREFFGHLEPHQRAAIEATMKDIVQRHGLKTVPTD